MECAEDLRQRGRRERQIVERLRTGAVHLADAQVERTWAIVSAHQQGLSIRQIAAATGLSSTRVHQLLTSADAQEIPVWLIDLAYYRGLTATEIASMAAIAVSTLKSRLGPGPTILRDTLRHDTDKRTLNPSHRSCNCKCDGRYRQQLKGWHDMSMMLDRVHARDARRPSYDVEPARTERRRRTSTSPPVHRRLNA